jgi:hypothetical protein
MPIPLKNYLNRNFTYRICFVNPVPFQTSLHFIHRQGIKPKSDYEKIRNAVWNKLFLHCERDFIKRLESYKPFAILNACTGGKEGLKKPDALKFKVKAAINNFSCSNYIYKFNTSHPCYWQIEKNRYCNKWQ